MKRASVNLSDEDDKLIKSAMAKKGIAQLSFSNMARKAISKFLKIDLPPFEHGGIREGGFEIGHEHGKKGAQVRWDTKKKN